VAHGMARRGSWANHPLIGCVDPWSRVSARIAAGHVYCTDRHARGVGCRVEAELSKVPRCVFTRSSVPRDLVVMASEHRGQGAGVPR
jgi:hypothetical protein